MEPGIPPAKITMLLFESLIVIKLLPKVASSSKVPVPWSPPHRHIQTDTSACLKQEGPTEKKGNEIHLALLSLFLFVWSSLVFLYISTHFLGPGSRTTQLCYKGTFAAPELCPSGEAQGRGIYHERGRCFEAAHSIQKLLLWNWAFHLLCFFF